MRTKAKATFKNTAWDEKPYLEMGETSKMTHANVTMSYSGDIQGETTQAFLMYYREDGTGVFTAHERLVGSIGGKSGTVVFQHEGTFDAKAVYGKWTVIPNSGTDELAGIRAESTYELAGHSDEGYPIDFEYWFE